MSIVAWIMERCFKYFVVVVQSVNCILSKGNIILVDVIMGCKHLLFMQVSKRFRTLKTEIDYLLHCGRENHTL